MKALYLADETRQNRLILHGEGVQPPVGSIQRQPQPILRPDGLVEEVITIECRGGGIWNFITGLEARLALARDGVTPLYLWLETDARLRPVGARVLTGRIEPLGGGTVDRARGYQGLRLYLVRANWLAEGYGPLLLNNANGANNITGLRLYNHADGDAGHVNFCDVRAEDIGGSQQTPARLVLQVESSPTRRLGRIVLGGGSNLGDAYGSYKHVLEGESATAGADCTASTGVASEAASSGVYQNFQWTLTQEAAVCRWTVSCEHLAWLAGRGLRPVARFHNPPQQQTRWRWKILAPDGGVVLDQSAQVLLDAASRLQVLPAVFPPVQSGQPPYQPFILEAWLENTTGGAKQIDLDFIHLLPLENFNLLQPLGGLPAGHELTVDWINGQCYAEDSASGEKSITHRISGAPLMLRPGASQRLYVLYETDSGFPISDSVKLRLQAGPRWIEP